MTFEKLINVFNIFVSGGTIDGIYFYPHGQLKSFGVGDYFKIDTQLNRPYPIMWCTPKPATLKNCSIALNFDVMFADILDSNESNLVQVWSDCLQYAVDFISFYSTNFGYGNPGQTLFDVRLDESNVSLEPFIHTLDNEVAGYFAKVSFIVGQNLNYCNIPHTIPPITYYNINNGSLFVNGNGLVLSGQTYYDSGLTRAYLGTGVVNMHTYVDSNGVSYTPPYAHVTLSNGIITNLT